MRASVIRQEGWLSPSGMFFAALFETKDYAPMTKSMDIISEVINNTKHPFRQVDDRPQKAQKHRYERRKVKEYIRLGEWKEENVA